MILNQSEATPERYIHICEVCGRREILTPEEAFEAGWDYPPRMGTFGVISARVCPKCPITKTLWWALTVSHDDPMLFPERHRRTLLRIFGEPESITPRTKGKRTMKQKILRNAIRCNHCGDVIESTYRHDFRMCRCGSVFVDGGHDYLRRGAVNGPGDYTDLSEVTEIIDETSMNKEDRRP